MPGSPSARSPPVMEDSVSSTSRMRPAATWARGRIMKIITSIMNAMTTWMAYCEKTIMSENSAILPAIADALMSTAPIQ